MFRVRITESTTKPSQAELGRVVGIAQAGATSSKPAASLFTSVSGCPSACTEQDFLVLVVRGTDNNVYTNLLSTKTSGWTGWSSLTGATLSAPTPATTQTAAFRGQVGIAVRLMCLLCGAQTMQSTIRPSRVFGRGRRVGIRREAQSLTVRLWRTAQAAIVQPNSYSSFKETHPTTSTPTRLRAPRGAHTRSVGGATNSDPQLVAVV